MNRRKSPSGRRVRAPVSFRRAAGAEIRRLRTSTGITQRTLAKVVGVNHSTISRWERGIEDIGLYQLLQVFSALDATADLKPFTEAYAASEVST